MVGFPNEPMGYPTKNDQHLRCEMGETHHLRKHPYFHTHLKRVFFEKKTAAPSSALRKMLTSLLLKSTPIQRQPNLTWENTT